MMCSALLASVRRRISDQWESLFFFVAYALLVLQVYLLYYDFHSLAGLHGAIAVFADFDSFLAQHLILAIPLFILPPLAYFLLSDKRPAWRRRFLDVIGCYLVLRMAVQLIGLNILVFDSVTPRFLLITQLLVFLPYSLMLWGWIYWRLDMIARQSKHLLFRLESEAECPRPIDYFVASFSSVFSATISGIKGNSARARILILAHGFVIYDLMGLTLSRAVALVQQK